MRGGETPRAAAESIGAIAMVVVFESERREWIMRAVPAAQGRT